MLGLCNDICKWLDFLVFSDKNEKLQVPSHNTFTDLFLWDEKRTHISSSKRVGVVDSGGVVNLDGLWDWVGMVPRMRPESHLCTFPLGRPVSRKAGK